MDRILANEFLTESKNTSIFTNEEYLSLDYIPTNVLFRDNEIKSLLNYFRPIFTNSEDKYTFIPSILVLGEPGTGKSLTIRRFGIELQKLIEQKKPTFMFEFRHINCRRNRTVFAVLVNLMKSFLPDFPSRGFSSSEILRMFQEMLVQTNIHLLIALDEINFLTTDPDFQNLLYSLSRLNEEYLHNFNQSISIILISQNELFLDYVDNAIKSSIYKNIINFEQYSKNQLFEILKDRASNALKTNGVSNITLEKIAELTEISGNARIAIEFLWRLAKKSEALNELYINNSQLEVIQNEIIPFSHEILKDLSTPQQIFLLSIIQCFERNSNSQFITLNQIKSEFLLECQELEMKVGTGNTSLWNHLQVLKKLEIIDISVVSKNYRGRFSKIFLRAPKHILKHELMKFLSFNLDKKK